MDEQKLNEAAEQYAGISEDKFSNSAKKYDAYDMTDAFSSGAHWHEQQNPWRKVENELPDIKKWVTIKKSDNTFYSISFQNKEIIKALRHTFIEWKYID